MVWFGPSKHYSNMMSFPETTWCSDHDFQHQIVTGLLWFIFLHFFGGKNSFGASQLQSSNYHVVSGKHMIDLELNLARANPSSKSKAPFCKEIFMSGTHIARELRSQLRAQPDPETHDVMQVHVRSFIHLGKFLPGYARVTHGSHHSPSQKLSGCDYPK